MITGTVSVLAGLHLAMCPTALFSHVACQNCPPLPSEKFLIPVNFNVSLPTCSKPGLPFFIIQSFLGRLWFPSTVPWAPGKAVTALAFFHLNRLVCRGHSVFFSLSVITTPCRFVAVTGVGEGARKFLWLEIMSCVELPPQCRAVWVPCFGSTTRVFYAPQEQCPPLHIALNPIFGLN